MRLQPHISFVEKTKLPSLIGHDMLTVLTNKIKEGNLEGTEYASLLNLIRPVVILFAAARLVRQAGTLTDKGLYFSSVMAGASGNDETSIIATREQAEAAAIQYEADANNYLQLADSCIKEQFPEYFRGKSNDVFNVDNSNRKIFWA